MIYVVAIIGYLAFYFLISWISERWSPLIGIGGLLLTLTVAHWLV